MKDSELEILDSEGSERLDDGWRKEAVEAEQDELVPDEAEVEAELQAEKGEQEQEWREVEDEDVGADANQDVGPSEVDEEAGEEQGRVNDSVLDESEEVDQEIHRVEADEALRAEMEQNEEEGELCPDTVKTALSMPDFWYIRCESSRPPSISEPALTAFGAPQRPALPPSRCPLDPSTTATRRAASHTPSSPPASYEAWPLMSPAALAPRRSSPSHGRRCSTTRPTTPFEFQPTSFYRKLHTAWRCDSSSVCWRERWRRRSAERRSSLAILESQRR